MSDPAEPEMEQAATKAKTSAIQYLKKWGESSLPPTLLATLILPLSLRPLQPVPLLFPPVLLFASYLNLNGFSKDAAGLSAAWSGLYLLVARRRRFGLRHRFGVRGAVRGAAMGVALGNLVGGGVTYAFARRREEEEV